MAHKLAILGPVPPPYGGIAVHVERLIPYLEREGIDFVVYNTGGPTQAPGTIESVAKRKKWWFFRYLLTAREPVVYMLNVKWQALLGTWALSRLRGKKVVLSLQGDDLRVILDSGSLLVRNMLLRTFHAATHVVVASQHLYDHLMSLGDFAGKTTIIPAFIPPSRCDGAEASDEIKEFCSSHSPVILATGASVPRSNGIDLYGIDMTLELADRLRSEYPKVGVLWSLLEFTSNDPALSDEFRARVKQRGLEKHWLFSRPLDVFYPVYELVDILVRPTLSDGDSLSVREALHFGVPTVASDAAPRPEGTIVFPNRDQDAYEHAVTRTLENLPEERRCLQGHSAATAVDKEVMLLREIVSAATRES